MLLYRDIVFRMLLYENQLGFVYVILVKEVFIIVVFSGTCVAGMDGKIDGRKLRGNFVRLRTAELKSVGKKDGISAIVNAEWNSKTLAEKASYASAAIDDSVKVDVIGKEVVDACGEPGGSVADSGTIVRKKRILSVPEDAEEGAVKRKHRSLSDFNVFKRKYCSDQKISWNMLSAVDLATIKIRWNGLSVEEKQVLSIFVSFF